MFNLNSKKYEKVFGRNGRDNGACLDGMRKCGFCRKCGGRTGGTIGVALAFGLSVVAMAYTIGNVSGCHINPAITLGVWMSGRMSSRDALMYMIFQIIGGIIGSLILVLLISTGGHGGPTISGANSFDQGEMAQAFIAEAVFTFILPLFLYWWCLVLPMKRKGRATLPVWLSVWHWY